MVRFSVYDVILRKCDSRSEMVPDTADRDAAVKIAEEFVRYRAPERFGMLLVQWLR